MEFASSIKALIYSFWKILKLKLIFEDVFFINWFTNSPAILGRSPIVAFFNLFWTFAEAFSKSEKSNSKSEMNEFSQVYNDSFIFRKSSFNWFLIFWELFFIFWVIFVTISSILVMLVISSIFILSRIGKYLL